MRKVTITDTLALASDNELVVKYRKGDDEVAFYFDEAYPLALTGSDIDNFIETNLPHRPSQ